MRELIGLTDKTTSLFCCLEVQSLTLLLLPGKVHSNPTGYGSADSVALFREANSMGIVLEEEILNAAMIALRSSRKSTYPT